MATKDVEMYWIEDDIEKIQKKTNMYIKSYNSAGAFHLVREIVQNAIDECIDDDSPGKKIYVSYDILANPYSTTMAQKKTETDAAKIIADDIALRLGAYFHSQQSKKESLNNDF